MTLPLVSMGGIIPAALIRSKLEVLQDQKHRVGHSPQAMLPGRDSPGQEPVAPPV
jgi:hypothetical protein